MIRFIAAMCAGLALISSPAHADDAAPAASAATSSAAVRVERISVDSPALAGNLEGNSARRDVIVVLPPSYASSPARRYPVVYALHGYGITPEKWFAMDKQDQIAARAFRSGVREMILVFPDTYTRHHGSMYSTSATTGDWEAFITRDLVGRVHRRALPHHRKPRQPRPDGPFDGRLWDGPARHEVSGHLFQPVCDERLLSCRP
jgi:enterochelin esterase-like enzyme